MKHNIGLYLHQARRYVLLALVPAIIIASLMYLYTKQQPSVYQASATLLAQQPASTGSGVAAGTDVVSSNLLAPTYTDIITDPIVTSTVDKQMAGQYPGYRVESHALTAGQKPGAATLVLRITLQDTIPARAALAANMVASVFIARIQTIQLSIFGKDQSSLRKQLAVAQANVQAITQQIHSYQGPASGLDSLKATLSAAETQFQTLSTSYTQFRIARDATITPVNLYSPALVPTTPVGPHPVRDAAIAGVVMLILAIAAMRIADHLDDSIRNPEEVETLSGAPVLGTVQRFASSTAGGALVTSTQPKSTVADSYRLIRTNLRFSAIDNPPRCIVFTSASAQEGKSTTASNLANVFAQGGSTVTLIDADLRRPSLHRIFSLARGEGLTTLLVRSQANSYSFAQPAEPNLRVIPSGPLPPNPVDLVGSERMRALTMLFLEQSDMVFIDSPPVLAVPEAAVLSTFADGVVLVVDLQRTKRRELRRTREAIEAVGSRILGVVVNRLTPHGAGYYYYHYNYQYSYESRAPKGREEVPEKVRV